MTRDDKRASSKHESVPGPAWPLPADDPGGGVPPIDDFPASERVWKADGAIRVPFRRITLGGGEPPVDVYDTFGPRSVDLRQGLPKLRESWIARKRATSAPWPF